MSGQTVERRIRPSLTGALATSPVVVITGARTAGESTLAREVEATGGGTFLDLDDPAVRRLAADDPMAFVRDLPEPVVIDELQRVPDVLAAIKVELNRDRRPGRFVLAGSARHQVVPELADFLTGRVELLTLWPFAMAELVPGAASVVDRLFDGSALRQRRASACSCVNWSRSCSAVAIRSPSGWRPSRGAGGSPTSLRWSSSGSATT